MDVAVALQRKKTIKILSIVDFSLSKQGIFFVLECRGFEQPAPAAAGRKSARWAVCEGAGALLFTHLTMQRQRLRCLRKKGIHPSMNSLFALSILWNI